MGARRGHDSERSGNKRCFWPSQFDHETRLFLAIFGRRSDECCRMQVYVQVILISAEFSKAASRLFHVAASRRSKNLGKTMGNLNSLECGYPAIYNDDVATSKVGDQPVGFLKAHLRDRPRNMLLEYRLIVNELVKQVEELIVRREKEQEQLFVFRSTSSSMTSNGSNAIDDVESVAGTTELVLTTRSPSVVTRASVATELAGNNKTKTAARRKSSKRPTHTPRMMGGNEFELREDLRKSIQTAVVSTAQSTSHTTGRLMDSMSPCSGPALFAPCAISQRALSFANSSVEMMIDEEMLVLHLKMPSLRCYRYYKMNLSRWKPHHPLSLAIENGIQTTNLAPSRNQPRNGRVSVPDLDGVSDDSSSSQSSNLEFGTIPTSHPVRLLVTDTVFMDLAISGSLFEKKRRPRATDMDRKLMKTPDQYTVLLNRRSGIPIAVCALKTPNKGPPVVRIFTTKHRIAGQTKAATTKQLGLTWCSVSCDLYPWAEIVTEGEYPERVRYSIYLTTDKQGEFEKDPSYKAVHTSAGSPEIRVVGRTERETSRKGCAILNICQAEDSEEFFMKVSVSRGIDPALLICFAAFVDEAMEKTMRKQYNSSV